MKGHDRDTSSGKPSATNRNCRAFPSLAKNSENLKSTANGLSRFSEN
jgi:hypothetical protein